MDKNLEAAIKRAEEKKEARIKARDEAQAFVDKFKAGGEKYIAIRIRDGYIGKELGGKNLQLERGKPRGTLVAIKGDNENVIIGISHLNKKDQDIPIVGVAEALKDALTERDVGVAKAVSFNKNDRELYNFFHKRALAYFHPEKYSYSRGSEPVEYKNYDKIHENRKRALTFIGREDLI